MYILKDDNKLYAIFKENIWIWKDTVLSLVEFKIKNSLLQFEMEDNFKRFMWEVRVWFFFTNTQVW